MSVCMWLFFSHTASSPKSCTWYSNSKNMRNVGGNSARGMMCRNSVGQELTTQYQHGWHKIQNDGAGTLCVFLEARTGDEKHIFTCTCIGVPLMARGCYGLVRNDPKLSPIHKKFLLYLWLEWEVEELFRSSSKSIESFLFFLFPFTFNMFPLQFLCIIKALKTII